MTILEFPPIDTADEHGLLAVGGDLDVNSLLLAYRNGIFPWPLSSAYLTWFAPPQRAILQCDAFRVSKSLRKAKNKNWAEFAINKNFYAVISACQELTNRTGQEGTWITDAMLEAYCELYKAGYAHSFECYREGTLVGGLYGVFIDGFFAAESMFYRYPDASKLTLWLLVAYLQSFGCQWLDIQVMTPLLKRLGAIEVERSHFMELLKQQRTKPCAAFDDLSQTHLQQMLSEWQFAPL